MSRRIRTTFSSIQQLIAIGRQRGIQCLDDAVGFDLLLAQHPRAHVFFRGLHRGAQHGLDLVIGEAVGRLHVDTGFDTAVLLAGTDGQQAVGIDLVGDADARSAGDLGRETTQFEACQ